MLISHNYISANWAEGIDVEQSYNGDIADNTLTGNGWASERRLAGGGPATAGSPAPAGKGPDTGDGGGNPYGAIYLPNTGGDPQLAAIPDPASVAVPGCASSCTITSRYSGHFYVQGNVLTNNFGGVYVYTGTDRFPGSNYSADSGCSDVFGPLNQMNNNATYYSQTKVLVTAADTAISGTSVTSSAGTKAQCSNYGATSGGEGQFENVVTAPSAGMGVYDQGNGHYLGNVATVTSAHAFTLNSAPGGSLHRGGCARAVRLRRLRPGGLLRRQPRRHLRHPVRRLLGSLHLGIPQCHRHRELLLHQLLHGHRLHHHRTCAASPS